MGKTDWLDYFYGRKDWRKLKPTTRNKKLYTMRENMKKYIDRLSFLHKGVMNMIDNPDSSLDKIFADGRLSALQRMIPVEGARAISRDLGYKEKIDLLVELLDIMKIDFDRSRFEWDKMYIVVKKFVLRAELGRRDIPTADFEEILGPWDRDELVALGQPEEFEEIQRKIDELRIKLH